MEREKDYLLGGGFGEKFLQAFEDRFTHSLDTSLVCGSEEFNIVFVLAVDLVPYSNIFRFSLPFFTLAVDLAHLFLFELGHCLCLRLCFA